jgi:imidazolonepropionase-like amidohydrolase
MNLEGEVGVIAPGNLADIVIWHSNPLADITGLQRPKEISLIVSRRAARPRRPRAPSHR